VRGEGTFRGSEFTNPYIGAAEQLETADEVRVEMVLPVGRKEAVVRALFASHPYEEPAYDLYPQEPMLSLKNMLWIGEFEPAVSWEELMQKNQAALPMACDLVTTKPANDLKIQRAAFSTGAGSSFIPMVAGMNVDVYLTGEVGYHQLWDAKERGLPVMAVGHGASESLFAETVIPLLQERIPEVEWIGQTRF
jgi:putative NIF3 family GTP cyclohydrolase 1 type 2